MLSISKLGKSVSDISAYHLGNYYQEQGKFKDKEHSKGFWHGRAAEQFGLKGEVSKKDFENMLTGKIGDKQLGTKQADGSIKHVPGWDLTFSAPKSVSLLAIIGNDKGLMDDHVQSTKIALDFIEKHAAYTRRRMGDQIVFEKTDKLAFACFTDIISRENDPQLHTHVVTMNATIGKLLNDIRSIESNYFYKIKMLGGLVYRNHLAKLVQERGYQIYQNKKGLFDIEGIDKNVLKDFSKRSEKLRGLMDDKGWTTAKEAAFATLLTRPLKTQADYDALEKGWLELLGDGDKQIKQTVQQAEHTKNEGLVDDLIKVAQYESRVNEPIKKQQVVKAKQQSNVVKNAFNYNQSNSNNKPFKIEVSFEEKTYGRWQEIFNYFLNDAQINHAMAIAGKHVPSPLRADSKKDGFRFHPDFNTKGGLCYDNQIGPISGVGLISKMTVDSTTEVARKIHQYIDGQEITIDKIEIQEQIKEDKKILSEKERKKLKFAQKNTEQILQKTNNQTIVEQYLKSRGLEKALPHLNNEQIRGVDSLYYNHDTNTPAMVSQVRNNEGNLLFLHRTYLDNQYHKNQSFKDNKKAMPSIRSDSYEKEYHIQVNTASMGNKVHIAEGIETALAVSIINKHKEAVFSTINTGGMKNYQPPEGVKEVVIWADNDKNKAGIQAAYKLADKLKDSVKVQIRLPKTQGHDFLDALNNKEHHQMSTIEAPEHKIKDKLIDIIDNTQQKVDEQKQAKSALEKPEYQDAIKRYGGIKAETIDYAIKKLEQNEAVFSSKDLITEIMAHNIGMVDFNTAYKLIQEAAKDKRLVKAKTLKNEKAWTTKAILKKEANLMQIMYEQKNLFNKGKLKPIAPNNNFANYGLTKGQQESAELILNTQDRFVAIQGYAGTGKTYMLNAVKEQAEKQGYTLIGMAPSASAANILEGSTGIVSKTVQKHLAEGLQKLNQKEQPKINRQGKEIWVVDESSFLDTRKMDALVKLAIKENTRIVFTGDVKQLGAIETGKPFTMAQKVIDTAYMTDIIRQKDPQFRHAVEALANRDIKKAFNQLDELNKSENSSFNIHEIQDREQRKSIAANLYLEAKLNKENVLLITPSNVDRVFLNSVVRNGLKEAGILNKEEGIITQTLFNKNLTRAEKTKSYNYRQGNVIRFNRSYQSLGVEQGEYFKIADLKYKENIIILKSTNSDKTIEWNPNKVAGGSKNGCEVYHTSDREVSVGDELMWRRVDKENNRRTSEEIKVTGINKDKNLVTFIDGHDKQHTMDVSNFNNKHWDYAYVKTAHIAQGLTVDKVIATVDTYNEQLTNQQSFYVELSRARHEAIIITDNKALLPKAILERSGEKSSAYLQNIEKTEEIRETERMREQYDQQNSNETLSYREPKEIKEQVRDYHEKITDDKTPEPPTPDTPTKENTKHLEISR